MGLTRVDIPAVGERMHELLRELYPHFRGLTGEGTRQTLARLSQIVPLDIHEVPSGTSVYDWSVPKEWRFRDAYVKDAHGNRVVCARRSNLHVINHSQPVRAVLPWEALRPRLHTDPARPDRVVYKHAFYHEDWGFCLSHRQLEAIEREGAGPYEVCIDAEWVDGGMAYGEVALPGDGTTADTVIFSAHVCHPSLANDNLSGVAVAAYLGRLLADRPRRLNYRVLFVPSTVGPLAWMQRCRAELGRVRAGLVLTGVGDPGVPHYKRSRRGDSLIDRAMTLAVASRGGVLHDFEPIGYDERQYCSPGFNLPVGCLMRTPWGSYPQYHSDADNPDFVRPEALADTLGICLDVVRTLETNRRYRNRCPNGEPQLGRRGVLKAVSRHPDAATLHRAVLWVLNLGDGLHDLIDVAERSGLGYDATHRAAELLLAHELLEPADDACRIPGQEQESALA